MKLIVGLGNPGKKYEKTRHNIGFLVLDELHEQLSEAGANAFSQSSKFNAQIAGLTYNNEKVILAKPLTFMNESGQAVQLIAAYYKISPRDIVVVHDDKDLPLGDIKLETGRGHAGHNGVKSIMQYIGTKDFPRLRIGVASKNERKMKDTAKFVLGRFGLLEKRDVQKLISTSVDMIKEKL